MLDVDAPDTEVVDPMAKLPRRGASATTKINRKDFGLAYNAVLEKGGVALGEDVSITIDVELVKKPAPTPATAKDAPK